MNAALKKMKPASKTKYVKVSREMKLGYNKVTDSNTEAYSEPYQASETECFTKIVNG